MAKRIGLALGGGGARGWAHVGVLRALEDADISIDYLAGTSIGALVGAIYVADALPELEQFAADLSLDQLLALIDLSFPNLGLINGQQIYEFLSNYLADRRIEECQTPFRCVATHFQSRKEVIFDSGPMVDAVRASISIPGILVPHRHGNTYLVDGGVVNPVPVRLVREMGAEITIAVNLNRAPKTEDAPDTTGAEPAPPDRARSGPARPETIRAAEMAESAGGGQDPQPSDTAEEAGMMAALTDRYAVLENIFQGEHERWLPDVETGLSIFDVVGNSINIMEQRLTSDNLAADPPDILIEPDLHEYGLFDFHRAKPMIQIGYDTARALAPQIKDALDASA